MLWAFDLDVPISNPHPTTAVVDQVAFMGQGVVVEFG